MINLLISVDLLPEKSTEFNQSMESVFRELINKEGLLLKKMSVSDFKADIVLTWNSIIEMEDFIESEAYHFLIGAITVLGDSYSIKREELA